MLTKQQKRFLKHFGSPDCPHTVGSEALWMYGPREQPTARNLINLGLIRFEEWDENFGNLYEITDEGIVALRILRDMEC